MKKFPWLIVSAFALAIVGQILTVHAAPYYPVQGGTGTSSIPTAGEVLIGNASGTYTPAYISCSGNCTIATSSGAISISVSGGSGGAISISPVSGTSTSFSIIGDGTYFKTVATATSTIEIEPATTSIAIWANNGLFLISANNLSDLTNSSTARANLGLGSAALQNTAYFLVAGNNLSDLTSTSSARTNIGYSGVANQITISGTGAIGFATTSISQFVNDKGYLTGNQTITIIATGDATGTALGTTTITHNLTITGLEGKALPSLATGTLKYTGGAWTFDGNTYLLSGVTVTTTAPLGGGGALTSAGLTLTCSTCLTGNQTITLTGAVTGSGATTIATTYTTSTLFGFFSATGPIAYNSSTGTFSWTNSNNYISQISINGNSGTSFQIVAGAGVTSTVSGATTTLSLNLNAICSGNQFLSGISATGTGICGTPTGGASSTNVYGTNGVTVTQVGTNATASINTAYAAIWTAIETFLNGITVNGSTTIASTTNCNILNTNASGTVGCNNTSYLTTAIQSLQGLSTSTITITTSTQSGTFTVTTQNGSQIKITIPPASDYLASNTIYVSTVNGSSGAISITSSSLGVVYNPNWLTAAVTSINGATSTSHNDAAGAGISITSTSTASNSTTTFTNTGVTSFTGAGCATASNSTGTVTLSVTCISGNQSITFTISGDATGTASGATSITDNITVTGLNGKTLPSLATGTLEYSGGAWKINLATSSLGVYDVNGNLSSYAGSTCSGGQFQTGVSASGTALCGTPGGGGTVTAVTGSNSIVSSGGTAPNISLASSTASGTLLIGTGNGQWAIALPTSTGPLAWTYASGSLSLACATCQTATTTINGASGPPFNFTIATTTTAGPSIATSTSSGSSTVAFTVPDSFTVTTSTMTYTQNVNSTTTVTTVNNSTATSTIYSYSVPANSLGTTKLYRITASGKLLDNSPNANSFTWYISYGGVPLGKISSAGTNSANPGYWTITASLQNASGTTNNQVGGIVASIESGSGAGVISGGAGSSSIDSTQNQTLQIWMAPTLSTSTVTMWSTFIENELVGATQTVMTGVTFN